MLLVKSHLRGTQCQVFNSDLKVNIVNTNNYTYPDLSVTCDERARENPFYITYPCLIVEVLSDSTEAYERGKKFERSRRHPNLIDYVLVSYNEIAIDIYHDIYHRNKAGDWLILISRLGDVVEIKSIGLSLPIEQFYEGIVFEPKSEIN